MLFRNATSSWAHGVKLIEALAGLLSCGVEDESGQEKGLPES